LIVDLIVDFSTAPGIARAHDAVSASSAAAKTIHLPRMINDLA
jgi:hypothetical protein